ncbi:MAG: pitrilysin family protein [Candidatus Lernaella stagnicola]|nr:pitrilysin family protein [Candidatus Lernaella stagnicola]
MAKNTSSRNRESGEPVLLTLPNGLRVVVQEVRFAPVVSMAVWVGVGSADEKLREAGLAHLHEHMIFKGTKRRGVGEIAAEIEGSGGEINAFTSYDQTCYYLTLGRDELKVGLDILADAMSSAAFDSKELKKEIQVVLEEMKLYRDLPNFLVSEACWAKAFEAHPYGRPILGLPSVLKKTNRRAVLRFYSKYYRPDNMVLTVAGDLDTDATLKLIKRLFSSMDAAPVRRLERAVEPAQTKFRGQVIQDPIRTAHLYLAWHGAKWDEPLAAELDLLSIILGHGYSSRLEHRVKAIKGLVHEVSAHVFAPRDPGVFGVDAVTSPDLLRQAYSAILTEVYRLRSELVREDEFDRARRSIEASFIGRRETAGGICQALGYSVIMTEDIHLVREYLQRVMSANREKLRDAAQKVLSHHNLTATALIPKNYSLHPRELDAMSQKMAQLVDGEKRGTAKPRPPAPSPALVGEKGRRGRLKKTVLANGVTLLVQETAHAPIVAMRTLMLGGARYEPRNEHGLSNLTANMLARGTKEKSAISFAKIVEGMAGAVHGVAGYNSIGVAAEFLSRDFDIGLGLVAEAMLQPAFRPTELKRAKEELIGHVRERLDSPSQVVRDLFLEHLYPSHPYGRNLLGTEDSLVSLDNENLAKYWRRLLSPANLIISIAGDVRFEEVLEQAQENFGKMRKKIFREAKIAAPTPPQGVLTADRTMNKEQVHLLVGFLGCRIGQSDEYALQVLNAALSGQGGRLFMELRDRKHLAYSVFSFHREGIERGSFGVYIGTGPQTAETAQDALLEQLERVVAKPPKGKEFERAKRMLIGSLQLDLQTAGSIALTMGLNELLGLGYRAHQRQAEKIRKVTSEQVAKAARKYIDLQRMVIARVGPLPSAEK